MIGQSRDPQQRAKLCNGVAVCGVGALVYGLCLVLFRAVSLSELKATLRREPGASTLAGLD